MTANEVVWAANHDWFIESLWVGAGYAVRVRDYGENGERDIPLHSLFTDASKLKQWAGY